MNIMKKLFILIIAFYTITNGEPEKWGILKEGKCKVGFKRLSWCNIRFNKAIEINPNYKNAYFKNGQAKIKLKQKESACLDFSKAGELEKKEDYEMINKYCN